ncbi:hypothetical protein JTB14_009843 [Gonioctena quinquepunctata]|nr:hypothetical protein JTB14_009843 [Gonioctena quinquepunctata]
MIVCGLKAEGQTVIITILLKVSFCKSTAGYHSVWQVPTIIDPALRPEIKSLSVFTLIDYEGESNKSAAIHHVHRDLFNNSYDYRLQWETTLVVHCLQQLTAEKTIRLRAIHAFCDKKIFC